MVRRAGSIRMNLSPGWVAAYTEHVHDLIWYPISLTDSADPFRRMG